MMMVLTFRDVSKFSSVNTAIDFISIENQKQGLGKFTLKYLSVHNNDKFRGTQADDVLPFQGHAVSKNQFLVSSK